MTVQFKAGQTYSCRSVCDHNCIFTFKVLSRTEKTVYIRGSMKTEGRRKVRVWNGVEQIDPYGRYSMAPILSADDPEIVS